MTSPSDAARLLAAASNAAAENRWADRVDPDRALDPAERERRIAQAKSEHFRALGRRSGEARRARAAAKAA